MPCQLIGDSLSGLNFSNNRQLIRLVQGSSTGLTMSTRTIQATRMPTMRGYTVSSKFVP